MRIPEGFSAAGVMKGFTSEKVAKFFGFHESELRKVNRKAHRMSQRLCKKDYSSATQAQ